MKIIIISYKNNNHASPTFNMTIASMKTDLIPTAEMSMDKIPVIDEETQQKFEKVAIRRLVRKLDWRLVPFMFLLEMGSYINRVSCGL
jgi:hypothetical protein